MRIMLYKYSRYDIEAYLLLTSLDLNGMFLSALLEILANFMSRTAQSTHICY